MQGAASEGAGGANKVGCRDGNRPIAIFPSQNVKRCGAATALNKRRHGSIKGQGRGCRYFSAREGGDVVRILDRRIAPHKPEPLPEYKFVNTHQIGLRGRTRDI